MVIARSKLVTPSNVRSFAVHRMAQQQEVAAVSREKFENTLAHELHHIGYSSSCPSKQTSEEIAKLPISPQGVVKMIGAFGEGFAMLAAAGGPNVHPHAVSNTDERAKLIECICDQRKLLPTYNKAAAKHNRRVREPLALWSESLIKRIKRSS